jgi:phage gp36-like protein
MAEYCTPADLGRHGINPEAIADLSDDEVKLPAIRTASAEIDGYLGRYRLPLLNWGDDLRACAAVIATWHIMRVRGTRPGERTEDDPLYLEYLRRLDWLKGIAHGLIHPAVTDTSSGATVGISTAVGTVPVISSNTLRGWYEGDPSRAAPFQGRRQS